MYFCFNKSSGSFNLFISVCSYYFFIMELCLYLYEHVANVERSLSKAEQINQDRLDITHRRKCTVRQTRNNRMREKKNCKKVCYQTQFLGTGLPFSTAFLYALLFLQVFFDYESCRNTFIIMQALWYNDKPWFLFSILDVLSSF